MPKNAPETASRRALQAKPGIQQSGIGLQVSNIFMGGKV
jgi:hypothetical protein